MTPRSTLFALGCAALVSLQCGGDNGGTDTPDARVVDFDERAMLDRLVTDLIVPAYGDFAARTTELETAVSAWCAALGQPGEDAARTAARDAWSAAMAAWQSALLARIGPASPEEPIGDVIYSWPVISRCAVDQDVLLRSQDPAYDITARLTNRRGLDALEYLLFYEALDTDCPPQIDLSAWDALSDADKRAARCSFAGAAATDLRTQAGSLAAAWTGADGYGARLVASGMAGGELGSVREAVDVVFGGLFYLDTQTKSAKLGAPAGLVANSCTATDEPCPADLESPWAKQSGEHIAANLAMFDTLFSGDAAAEGPGFEDFLRAAGAGDLADQMTASIAAARAAIESLPGPLVDALASEYEAVVAAHAAIREVTTPLKTTVAETLGLTVPTEAGGDTD